MLSCTVRLLLRSRTGCFWPRRSLSRSTLGSLVTLGQHLSQEKPQQYNVLRSSLEAAAQSASASPNPEAVAGVLSGALLNSLGQSGQPLAEQIIAAFPDTLPPDGFVTLALLSSFCGQSSQLEKLLEHYDLEKIFSHWIKDQRLSHIEIAAVSTGLDRLSGFALTHMELRAELYRTCELIADRITSENMPCGWVSNEMLRSVLRLLLNQAAADQPEQVLRLMGHFQKCCRIVEPLTAVAMMSFGMQTNLHHTSLTESVIRRLADELNVATLTSSWCLADMERLLAFCRMVDRSFIKGSESLLHVLQQAMDLVLVDGGATTMHDGRVWMAAFCHLVSLDAFSHERAAALLTVANQLPNEHFSAGHSHASSTVGKALAEAILPAARGLDCSHQDALDLVRMLCWLDQTLAVMHPDLHNEHGLLSDRLNLLIESTAAEHRGRQVATRQVYEILMKVLGPDYVKLARILPHFPEPDIVLGHIGGHKIRVPDYLFSNDTGLKRCPESGEWIVFCLDVLELPHLDAASLCHAGSLAETCHCTQLKRLGFHVETLSSARPGERFSMVHRKLASSLSGNSQDFPDVRRTIIY